MRESGYVLPGRAAPQFAPFVLFSRPSRSWRQDHTAPREVRHAATAYRGEMKTVWITNE